MPPLGYLWDVHNFRRLDVWRDGVTIAESVYKLTKSFPVEERFGLTAQMRSAAVSISSNIAEGAGRGGTKEMARFLRIAMGSIAELESQLELAVRLDLMPSHPDLIESLRVLMKMVLKLHDRISGTRHF